MDTQLQLTLLGAPQICVNQQPLTERVSKKARALLFYLAMTGRAQARDSLMALFWPEMNESQARNNLRTVLPELNKSLGDHLSITTETVKLERTSHCWVDVHAFETALAGLSAPTKPSLAAPAALQQALQLYQGEFLQGFHIRNAAPFEDWLLGERERLRLRLINGLTAFSEQCIASGEYASGISATRRLLVVEPWLEQGHLQLMRLLAHNGQRSEALQQYEICKKIMCDEFDAAPSEEIKAFYQQLQTGDFMGRHSAVSPTPQAVPVNLPPARGHTIPNNLTQPLSAFVGRRQELADLCQRLADDATRLLTIVGPGGMGKTSLAQAAAQHLLTTNQAAFPDGIFFVSLADIGTVGVERQAPAQTEDPTVGEAILRAIAQQIGYKLEAGTPPIVQLQTYLERRQLLLILDNFEHLLAGTAVIVTLLSKAAKLKLLITSRARLNVRGETILPLAKLSLPTAAYAASVTAASTNPAGEIQAEAWQASEAVAMFLQRAQQFDHTFALNAGAIGPVVQICQLVEGLPLGIELATSMLPLLNCRTLAEELTKSLDFLVADTRDLPSDQRTLGAVFERSWRLLPPQGQELLAKLALFPGSFNWVAAERIAGASLTLLRRLLDQSLLSKVGDERYVMHRTVHAFAQQKLKQWPEQSATLHARYAHFYLEFLARLEEAATEDLSAAATAQIQLDLDNIRTAWRWSIAQGDLALLTLGVGGLQDFYRTAGIYAEAIQLLEAAMPTVRQAMALEPTAIQPQRLLARLLCYTVEHYRRYRRSGADGEKKVESWANEAIELGRRLADPALQALAYHILARLALGRVDFAAMCQMAEQACIYARQANLPHLLAENLNDLGIGVGFQTHPLASSEHFHQALACLEQQPNRPLAMRIIANLGLFHLAGHAYQSAYQHLQQRRALQSLLQDRESKLATHIHFGELWMAVGDYTVAQQEFAQAFALTQNGLVSYWESWLHIGYGRLQRLCGDLAVAQRSARLALQIAQTEERRTEIQWALIELGHVLSDLGDFGAAAACYQQAIALPTHANWVFRTPDAHAGLAAVALAQNDSTTALTQAEAALSLLTQQGLAAAGEPFAVYWTCLRVLEAAGDPRWQSVLLTAYQQLQEIANQLEDQQLRHSFLKNVVANRHLVTAAQAAKLGTKRDKIDKLLSILLIVDGG